MLQKWQRIVDLLANIVHVPSAVVCKLEPPDYTYYRIVATSNSEGNPFPVDDAFSMDIGTFCETVIKSREPLLVANALEDDRWKTLPSIQVGMVSYFGFPVVWPDGRMFGTICVLDDKANRYSDLYQELLLHCRDVLEADLKTLVRLGDELEDQRAHLSELFARVPEAVVMVDRDFKITRINPSSRRSLATRRKKRSVSDSKISLPPTICRKRSKASWIGWSRRKMSSPSRPSAAQEWRACSGLPHLRPGVVQ